MAHIMVYIMIPGDLDLRSYLNKSNPFTSHSTPYIGIFTPPWLQRSFWTHIVRHAEKLSGKSIREGLDISPVASLTQSWTWSIC